MSPGARPTPNTLDAGDGMDGSPHVEGLGEVAVAADLKGPRLLLRVGEAVMARMAFPIEGLPPVSAGVH